MSLQDTYDAMYAGFTIPTISGALDNVYSIPETPKSAPVAQSQSSQSFWQKSLDTLTSLFDRGVEAYNDIANKTGLPKANGQPTDPQKVAAAQAASPSSIMGLTQSQFLMVAGGVGLIVLLVLLKRK